MGVKINKEIQEYTESIFFGLTMKQCFFSVIAIIVAVIIYFFTIDTLGMELTSWLCILGARSYIALGFITYQGINVEEIFMTAIYSFLLSKTQLIFQPINIYYETLKPYIESKIKEESKSYDKKLREIKKERKTKK